LGGPAIRQAGVVYRKRATTCKEDVKISHKTTSGNLHAMCARAGNLNGGGQRAERWRPRKLSWPPPFRSGWPLTTEQPGVIGHLRRLSEPV